MGCTVCGSNVPCRCASGCSSDPVLPCGCGSGISANRCCQNVVQATPTPFFACAPACPENHTQKIVLQQFFGTIQIADSWNIPACGMTAVVNVVGLKSINVGAYIWNSTYGYFEVTAFNSGTGQVTILNHCTTGNAAPGTAVPACTDFTITDPPCDCANTSQICVAIDFTAPDNGNCIDITLTTNSGLIAGDTVQIGSGFYVLSVVKTNNIVTICNEGQGITPGTPVIAKDINGNYQYCLTIISTNPCSKEAASSVVLLGCNNGNVLPLAGTALGQVPVLSNLGSSGVIFKSLTDAIADDCIPQAYKFEIIQKSYAFNIGIGGSDQHFDSVIDSAVIVVSMPSGSCNYLVRADLNVAVGIFYISGVDTTQPTNILVEVDTSWVSSAGAHAGKLIGDLYAVEGSTAPAGVAESIQKVLPCESASLPGNFSLTYMGGSIVTFATRSGGQNDTLQLIFRCATGEKHPPTNVDNAVLLIEGYVTILRV